MNSVHRIDRSGRRAAASPHRGRAGSLGLAAIVTDVVLAAAWAAMIPGLLWLGAAGGF